jgi:hypothetical protein
MQSPTPIQNCKLERDKRTLIITVEGELILINHIALPGGGEQWEQHLYSEQSLKVLRSKDPLPVVYFLFKLSLQFCNESNNIRLHLSYLQEQEVLG